MKIASSTMQLAASHVHSREYRISERLELWHDQRRAVDTARVSDEARALQQQNASAPIDENSEEDVAPELAMLRQLVEYLTGRSVRLFNPAELRRQLEQTTQDGAALSAPDAAGGARSSATRPPPRHGWGAEYQRDEYYREAQAVEFRASGSIQTADGRSFQFEASLSLAREVTIQSSTHLALGDGARPKKDPLVINYAAPSARLLDSSINFDVDSDGATESVQRLAAGSGYLALDRNGDGTVNDGNELFGTQSGNGLADLAAFDADANGWIDENDSVWGQLRLWVQDDAGTLLTLKQADVGAIFLGSVATPMQLDMSSGEGGGELVSSGIFLHEDGTPGTVQQVDLYV